MDRCSIKHGGDSKSTDPRVMTYTEYSRILGKRSSILLYCILLYRQIQNFEIKLNSAPIVRWIIIRHPAR
jgi:hypothetical protein